MCIKTIYCLWFTIWCSGKLWCTCSCGPSNSIIGGGIMRRTVILLLLCFLLSVSFANDQVKEMETRVELPGCYIIRCYGSCFRGDQGYDCVLTGRAANFDGNGNPLAVILHLYLDCYVVFFLVQSCSFSGDFSGIGEVEGSVGCFINTGPYEGSCFTYESSCACSDS
jgi:hypothetical protein